MEFLDLEGKSDRDIIFSVFGLNDLQKSIFRELEDSKLTVKEVAESVDRNRSTVQRALQELLESDLVMREGRTDRTVYYLYTTVPIEEVREVTLDVVDEWHEEVRERL
ncbi:MAG: helix-turn-helix domain-containing protein [Candidatus Nanohaloarchaea archaeon]